ncbi:MAG: methyl-accepting chemotaxis protein [bacterium]|nr:methyl-accepting chemotaxis protein [bacterium]
MNKNSIRTKIAALNILSILLVIIIFMAIVYIHKNQASERVDAELDKLINNDIGKTSKHVYKQLETLNEILLAEVESGLNVARSTINTKGKVTITSETVQWTAVNQYTKEEKMISLPKMKVGGQWLGQNRSMATPSPVVDDVFKMVGGTTTIFQKMNAEGDMLRVCTNVKKKDNSRAIGTFIPAKNPDGKANPVIQTIMQGSTYRGKAYVVNAWYLTVYEPIYNDSKEVIGVLYFGIQQEKSKALRKGIMETIVGKTGYIYVLQGKGSTKGYYVISYKGVRDGENIYNTEDADGRKFIQNIIKKATKLDPGQVDFERYPWKNKDETEARMKRVAITYFQPWDWVVGASCYEDDFKDARAEVEASLNAIVLWGLISAIASLTVIFFLSLYFTRKITDPLNHLSWLIKDIAEGDGDLTKTVTVNTKDEVYEVASWFNQFIEKLVHIIRQIKNASTGIHDSTEEISNESYDLAARTNQQAASLTETSTTLEEFTKSVRTNADDAAEAEMMLQNLDHELKDKGSLVDNVTVTMDSIFDSSKKIDNIVNVINEISFQTNLLALNAAVEAARAGEAGRGFAVVAAEVRNLAQKTSDSSKTIRDIVSSNVEATQKGMELVKETSDFFKEISGIMDETVAKVSNISNSSREQQTGIEQINTAIIHLNDVSNQNATLVDELSQSTKSVKSNTVELEELVEKFKV